MQKTAWTERQFAFGLPIGMVPFYLERLRGTAARLEQKVNGVSEEILSEKLDGKWSVKQNIGHLAEVDEIAIKRVEEVIHGISPMSSAVFETKQDYNAMPVQKVLQYFRENRKKVTERYKTLSDDELLRTSLHPRLKVQMSLTDLAWFGAEHDDHHSVRMNEIIETLSK